MRLIDANVLIYAVNSESPQHLASKTWLESALNGGGRLGLSWTDLLAFLRLTTRSTIMPSPLRVADALELIDEWLAQPSVSIVQPTAGHSRVLANLLAEVGTGGNLVNDAHLAALAIEHRAEVVSYDADFARFPGVRWRTPEG